MTFAEQIAGLTGPHSRYTPLAREQLTSIALALAGRAGARLAGVLGLHVTKDALLRLVRATPEEPVGEIHVFGVDDFALRKGDSYATILELALKTRLNPRSRRGFQREPAPELANPRASDCAMSKVRNGERGRGGVERRLVALGARPREEGEPDRAWLEEALQAVGA